MWIFSGRPLRRGLTEITEHRTLRLCAADDTKDDGYIPDDNFSFCFLSSIVWYRIPPILFWIIRFSPLFFVSVLLWWWTFHRDFKSLYILLLNLLWSSIQKFLEVILWNSVQSCCCVIILDVINVIKMSSLVERSFIDNKELIVLEYSYYRLSFKWCFSVSRNIERKKKNG